MKTSLFNVETKIVDLYYILLNKEQGRLKDVVRKGDVYMVMMEWRPEDGSAHFPFMVVLEPNDES